MFLGLGSNNKPRLSGLGNDGYSPGGRSVLKVSCVCADNISHKATASSGAFH